MTPNEVIKYSGVKLPFNPCSFQELHAIEYHQARTCLGFDLWEAMVAAVADYSATADWVSGTTYNQADLVKFQGYVYIATAVTTTEMPTVKADWSLAPKFDSGNACATKYDDFFCNFLAPYLAKKILHQRLPYVKTRIMDMGILEYADNRYETAEEDSVTRLQNAIGRDAAMAWGNLQHYMDQDAQKDDTCLAGYLEYQTSDDECSTQPGGCRPKRSRVGIYRFG